MINYGAYLLGVLVTAALLVAIIGGYVVAWQAVRKPGWAPPREGRRGHAITAFTNDVGSWLFGTFYALVATAGLVCLWLGWALVLA